MMQCGGFLRGMALGLLVGAGAELLIPGGREARVRRQMKHALRDMEDILEQTAEHVRSALDG